MSSNFGWETESIYSTAVLQPEEQENSTTRLQEALLNFVQNFRLDNSYVYRDQLRNNLMREQPYLQVDVGHLISYDARLGQMLNRTPADVLYLFENAVKEAAKRILFANPHEDVKVPDCQVMLKSDANVTPIRSLIPAMHMGQLVRVPGIVIGAATLTCRATYVHVRCRYCGNTEDVPVSGGFSGISVPRVCNGQQPTDLETQMPKCPLDPFVIVHEKSKFVDQQVLKLQEAPDMVPTGELPRHMVLNADRWLCNKVVPGTRVEVMGIYSIFQNKQGSSIATGAVATKTPYIRVVGITTDIGGGPGTGAKTIFTDEEEEEFIQMSRQPNVYEQFAASIAPSIFGNEDIKKAIACLLFGGSRKILPDGMKLRGDINVLLLGDPGTAKSQLLKFVQKVAPIAVYTSGKGSSAAGLTASVIRDNNTGEFYLEGGAMVLADGGVVCIDEFDKMRNDDRVAIHEAMEQQTISIAKAGITTILNSRTSVLAAANPVFGRYDDLKSAGENIDFQTTILSRFDMIFIVKDEHNEQLDMRIARHVLNVHMDSATTDNADNDIDLKKMRDYVSYCKAKCAPKLSAEAADKLSSHFVSIRKDVKTMESTRTARSSIPITIRQLEAIVRISESLAKMTLSPVANEKQVDEAIRLFKFSTMDAVNAGSVEGMTRSEVMEEVQNIEKQILRRLAVGSTVPVRVLKEEMEREGFSETATFRAMDLLCRRETLQLRQSGKVIYRRML
ncbi:hypothetical protein BZG36_00928 [Bifiguratus adelaidae]|uniref:DNA replication licensing factor MCM5 n=1 Tax=Bifiguratus adelaidae TaxID=1938954 RepID=A0A261Y5J6_9FUNG|nr:hypothetical protein BZG36_00928 [Bifiguratus adelaidae]